jgi:hypothetical protein
MTGWFLSVRKALIESPEFGTMSILDIVYNDKGQTTKTYQLDKRQSIAVASAFIRKYPLSSDSWFLPTLFAGSRKLLMHDSNVIRNPRHKAIPRIACRSASLIGLIRVRQEEPLAGRTSLIANQVQPATPRSQVMPTQADALTLEHPKIVDPDHPLAELGCQLRFYFPLLRQLLVDYSLHPPLILKS